MITCELQRNIAGYNICYYVALSCNEQGDSVN